MHCFEGPLSLSNIEDEKRFGLASHVSIQCKQVVRLMMLKHHSLTILQLQVQLSTISTQKQL